MWRPVWIHWPGWSGRWEERGRPNPTSAGLKIRKRALGEAHPHVALSLNNLTEYDRALARYDDARHLYEQVLAFRKQTPGSAEHPDVASSLHALVEIRTELRNDEEALSRRCTSADTGEPHLGRSQNAQWGGYPLRGFGQVSGSRATLQTVFIDPEKTPGIARADEGTLSRALLQGKCRMPDTLSPCMVCARE